MSRAVIVTRVVGVAVEHRGWPLTPHAARCQQPVGARARHPPRVGSLMARVVCRAETLRRDIASVVPHPTAERVSLPRLVRVFTDVSGVVLRRISRGKSVCGANCRPAVDVRTQLSAWRNRRGFRCFRIPGENRSVAIHLNERVAQGGHSNASVASVRSFSQGCSHW